MSEKEVKLRYTGGVDEVDVKLRSGRVVTVRRNHQVAMDASDAEPLVGHPDWAEVAPPKESKET